MCLKKKWMVTATLPLLLIMLFTSCGSQQGKSEMGEIGRVTTPDTYP